MPSRSLTEIELALTRRTFVGIVEQLSHVWRELFELDLGLLELESQVANVDLAPPSEPTVALTIETRSGRMSSTMSLLVPHRSIASVTGRLSSQYADAVDATQDDDALGELVRASIGAVEVEVRAEVGTIDLTIGEVLELARRRRPQARNLGERRSLRLCGRRPPPSRSPGPERLAARDRDRRRAGEAGMTSEEALLELAQSTAEAVLGVLSSLCPDGVEMGSVAVAPNGTSPLQSVPAPSVATNVSYVDGVTGGNVFVVTRLGARRLAASMMGMEPPAEDDGNDLDEIELSAVGEAMNQSMAAAAGATGKVLGQEVEISVPETRVLAAHADAEGAFPTTPHTTTTSFVLLGEPCRLIQLLPNAFIVRMTRALSDRVAEHLGDGTGTSSEPILSPLSIRELPVQVAVELGRARLPLARAVGLGSGALVELDRLADDPIDLYVNGRRFATGRLLLIDQTEWAVRVERVLDVKAAYEATHQGGI